MNLLQDIELTRSLTPLWLAARITAPRFGLIPPVELCAANPHFERCRS